MKTTRGLRVTGAAALVAALLLTGGCVRVELDDTYESAAERVEAEDASAVKATIGMAAGELTLRGGATDLMNADFDYSDESWKPEVTYEVSDGEGDLRVLSPDRIHFPASRNTRYGWDVALSDELPMELVVNMGAGKADLDLRGLDLRDLKLNLGAGETTIDLSGEWANDLSASIEAGAGQLTLRVPTDVGVRIVGYRDGLGEYSANGFKQDGDALVNDAWENATVKFDIVLRRGVGKATIEMVD